MLLLGEAWGGLVSVIVMFALLDLWVRIAVIFSLRLQCLPQIQVRGACRRAPKKEKTPVIGK